MTWCQALFALFLNFLHFPCYISHVLNSLTSVSRVVYSNGMDTKIIGQRIAGARRNAGYSQAVLAEICGVTRPAVTQWEAGNRTPGVEYFAIMAIATHTTLDWLVLGRGNPPTSQ